MRSIDYYKRIERLFLTAALAVGLVHFAAATEQAFPKVKSIRAVTSGPKHHFASAYYCQHTWSASERYVLCLQTDLKDTVPTPRDKATLGMIDLETGAFIALAKTAAWNFQQGAMQQWLGSAPDSEIIYNDCRDGRFVSVILNVHTREERVLPKPVLAVSPDGRTAVSASFLRLEAALPGFGYVGSDSSSRIDVAYPKDDGLWKIDLESGEASLLVSMAEVHQLIAPPTKLEGPFNWLMHPHYNPDGTRIYFEARSRKKGSPMASAALTVNPDGSDLRCIMPYDWDATHFDWLNNEQLVVTAAYNGKLKLRSHVLFTDGKDDYRILSRGALVSNGHPTFSPDGRWLLTDTYPDQMRKQTMFFVNMETEAVLPVRSFYSPSEYRGSVRCDLHALWNHQGDKVVFDSAESGTRQVYVMELE